MAAVNRGNDGKIPISTDTCWSGVCFIGTVLVSVLLVWKRWITLGLTLYTLIPFVYLMIFDEISTIYKTPFVGLSSLLLSAGVIAYQHRRSSWLGWLILLAFAAVTVVIAAHAANGFWDMSADLGYQDCLSRC